ncbi:MAG: hypothetical protein HXS44_00980 [Theionarchaea archaeon]|nr:hypothetical protein [Theionarchaea archaeon]
MRVETKYKREDPMIDTGISWIDPPDLREFVINTKEDSEMELVGGKALNISHLSREGFAVPEGFCITTKAYDYFMEFNSIPGNDAETGDEIRKGVIPPLLEEIIRNAYNQYMDGKPCAVRSSSPAEDLKSASFAGQYKSFLNVQGEDALLDAIKECWASLWNRSVMEYRKKMGIRNEGIRMAVLVQEMYPATASGVLFTEDQMIIEAVWGLGDVLVGGKVIPDRFVVEREKLSIVERTISHKQVMSQISPDGGLTLVDVPDHLRAVPVLGDHYIQELCALGKRVEELFGCPQDIEWALCDSSLVLLQARPISVKQKPVVWSRANVSETQPGYVTYLSRIPENKPDDIFLGLLPLLECFGIKDIPKDIKFREYIYGHAYLNMTTIHETLGRIPGLSPKVLDQSLGHSSDEEEEVQSSTMGISDMVKILPGTLRVIRFFLSLSARAESAIPDSVEVIETIKNKNLEDMTLEELDSLVWTMYERNSQVFQVHSVTALAAMSFFGILQKILARVGEEGAETLLTIGLEGMSSSQMGIEIWNLSQNAAKSSRVSELILSRREDALKQLKQFPDGLAFLEELDDFVDRFGDRGSQEMEFSVPRWGENPSFVLSMIANYLSSSVNPARTMDEQKKARQEATDRILNKFSKNPLERVLFEKILQKAQQYIVVRENLKTTWVRGLSAMRFLYLTIADKFVNKEILENRDDIFYLKMTEISDIIAGTLGKEELRDRINERKKEKIECEGLDVPEVIVGKPSPIEELKGTVDLKEKLEGIGCSHGVITGRARVVLDPSECSEFNEGEILVAPITDPGWSPLFVTAGGLVMELGGTLSHGVIIAREYGIPVVVGVKNAVKIIKTGQLITVDGSKGTVSIRE